MINPQRFRNLADITSPEILWDNLPVILKLPPQGKLNLSKTMFVRAAQVDAGDATCGPKISQLPSGERMKIAFKLRRWSTALKELAFPQRYSVRDAICLVVPDASTVN